MESLSIRKKRKKPKSKKGGSPQTVRGDQHHDRPGSRSGKKRRRRASGGTHANQRRLRLESNPSAEHSIQTKKKKRKNGKGISLVDRFKTKLEGSQFRYLNEELYTAPSETSFKMVKQNAALFDIYHKGFQAQVQRWPANPVQVILSVSSGPDPYGSVVPLHLFDEMCVCVYVEPATFAEDNAHWRFWLWRSSDCSAFGPERVCQGAVV